MTISFNRSNFVLTELMLKWPIITYWVLFKGRHLRSITLSKESELDVSSLGVLFKYSNSLY